MTTNTAPRPATIHMHCDHEVSKAARAKCRRTRGAAYARALVARSTVTRTDVVVEPCTCRNAPAAVDNTCPLCDRPTNVTLLAA